MTSRKPAAARDRADVENVFAGGGEMGELMRSMDWSRTPLGPVSRWPQSLRTTVSTCLDSKFPILIWWGPQMVKLYNDAYRPILGDKHPRSMGAPGREVWSEIWHIIGPMLDGVISEGKATWSENQMLPMNRHGFTEEAYFTFSYSPIRDESGGIGGIFCAVTETTGRVLGERRLLTLRDVAARTARAAHVEDACRLAGEAIAENPADLPFALIYLVEGGRHARLVCATGVDRGLDISPALVDITAGDAGWPFANATANGTALAIDDLRTRFSALPGGAAEAASAMVFPVSLPGETGASLVFVAGLSNRLVADAKYRDFLELLAGNIATAIANTRTLEAERRRAEALAEIDRAKTVFFSNISHEFRTPLTLMLGPVEDLLAGVHGRVFGTQRVQLSLVHRNALRMQKLVNALLDFSRVESGRIEATYQPVDLAAFTRDLASTFRSTIERAGLTFSVDCPPLGEAVHVDRDMWEKIVLNLLSNAFKFTLKGGIKVSLYRNGDAVALRVSDTGTGIPAAELPHLFQRFHRVHGAQARTHEGSGIGLAFVQELARLHGGQVDVESSFGKGSTFTVTLPVGVQHLPPDRVRTAVDRTPPAGLAAAPFIEEALSWLQGYGETDVMHAPASSAAQSGLHAFKPKSSGRILLADDNADMLDYIRRILEPYWSVETRRNGEEALVAARANPPDLVLADVMMPGLDGFELLRELRQDKRTRNIPVVMLSARAGEEARVEGLHAGAEDYLTKPFSARELLARVNTQLELAKLRGAIEAERQKLHHVFSQAPVAIAVCRGPQHVYELANPWYLRTFNRRDVIGKTVREVYPEPDLAGLWKIWDHVYATGETYTNSRYRAKFARHRDGSSGTGEFAFTLSALRDDKRQVNGVVAVAIEVTEAVATT